MRSPFLSLPALALACAGPVAAPPAAPPPPPVSLAPTSPSTPSPTPSVVSSAAPADGPTDAAPSAPAAPAAGSVEAANTFAFRLFAQLRKHETGNVFAGPASLRTALAMTALGAKAATLGELSATLGMNADPTKLAEDARDEDADLVRARGKGAQLLSANRLFVARTFPLLPTFNAAAERGFGAGLELVDFSESEKARATVNRWVSEHTASKIPALLPERSVDGDTRLVLANAMYFKGAWVAKFKPGLTRVDPFYVAGPTAQPVPTMHRTGSMTAAAFPGGKILELPYDRSDLAMDVVLPDGKAGLDALEANLDEAAFAGWTRLLRRVNVELSLPKIKLDWGGPVAPDLKELGIRAAFSCCVTPVADFTGIAAPRPDGPLFVSNVFHRAFVAIDESGTEAAAASAVVMTLTTSVEPPPQNLEFKADHPFFFVIRDTKKGRILFMGHYRGPSA